MITMSTGKPGEGMTLRSIVCDRCRTEHPATRSYSVAGVSFNLCDPCHAEFYRPETPDRPRDPRDITLDWLF